ncbi:MAG: hypothetical protein HQL72_11870 [Magnetococcales bacterium]|nr:hypothetical protein [Magnetococcales bacterium]
MSRILVTFFLLLSPLLMAGCGQGFDIKKSALMEPHLSDLDWNARYGTEESFQKVLHRQQRVANRWADWQESHPQLSDHNLDQLVAVFKAGYLQAYVWTYFRQERWQAPDGIDLSGFEKWRSTRLINHSPL